MSMQLQSFGEPEEAFDIATLKGLIYKAKSMKDLIPAKAYFLSYFRVCSKPHGSLYNDLISMLLSIIQ